MTSRRPIAHLPARRRLFIRVHHAPALHASSSTITPEVHALSTLHTRLKRTPRFPVPPPRSSIASSSATLTLTIKSLRPPAQYSLAVHPTDSFAYPAAPPADTQRLLLKGTALADNKLVTESSVKDGDTLNLLLSLSIDLKGRPSLSPSTGVPAGRGYQRIPSVVLSSSPSAEAPPSDLPSSSGSSSPSTRSCQNSATRDITLTFDDATPALVEQELSVQHDLPPPADAQRAFEELLRTAKGTLTVSEIARLWGQAGVTGMGEF
ncbi:ubiquitin-domain-containing protein [Mycena rebaudengoi]|nr:ubiquitin-domain-containing protein [Mycena rebaudengoi]